MVPFPSLILLFIVFPFKDRPPYCCSFNTLVFFFFSLSVSVSSKQALLDLPAFVLRFSRSHAPNLSQNLIYNHFFLYFHPGSLIFPAVFQAHKWVWSWAFGYLSGYPWASLNHQNTALSHYYWLLPCQLLPSSTLMVCLFNSICHRIPVLLHSPRPLLP